MVPKVTVQGERTPARKETAQACRAGNPAALKRTARRKKNKTVYVNGKTIVSFAQRIARIQKIDFFCQEVRLKFAQPALALTCLVLLAPFARLTGHFSSGHRSFRVVSMKENNAEERKT